MKKILKSTIFLLPIFASAQGPLIKLWDSRFGGYKSEHTYSLQFTSDGGYLMGGFTASDSSADITQHTRDTAVINMDGVLHGDYWIVKTDPSGTMQWNKRYGGDKGDYLFSTIQTPDDGYLLGGSSHSGISGERTEPNRNPTSNISSACEDYWIVKTDSLGSKQWDKRFGGNSGDRCYSVIQSSANCFLLAGYSFSPVSGDKTMAQVNNSSDFWVVKTNASGTKIWDKVYGGPQSEAGPVVIKECADGGFAICGQSWSEIGGDKTDSLHDTLTTSVGFRGDFWIVKIDSSGNKLWDKTFGGASVDWFNDFIITSDGGFLLGGYTWSQLSGDVTEPSRDTSLSWLSQGDFWIVKTDSLGNKQWDKRFGGEYVDYFSSIQQTPDGGYLLAGESLSGIGGDKSEITTGADTWLVKTDSMGNKQWDKTIFNRDSNHEHALMTDDGCIIISTSTASGIGGYVSHANKDTSGLNQTLDYWLTKFCDSTMVSSGTEKAYGGIVVFPNPAGNKLTISCTLDKISSIEVYNVIGVRKTMDEINYTSQNSQITLNVSKFEPGIYILRIYFGEKTFYTKFIKQ
ncbi:MAG: T9SS type A sorting domain-containing protein [Bacteroidetes bacterium]|nr:T9SS type A sorting domain-containing protein [Bacteroidota bacterium]